MKLYRNFIFILLFLPSISFSQNFKIFGYIDDVETDLPIEKASIDIKNSKNVTITNKFGYFEIYANKLPVVIIISHLCYKKVEITLQDTNSLPLKINLRYKINVLKEVNINDKNVEKVSNNPQLWAYDYDFFENNILILNLKNIVSHAFLYLINDNGDTLCTLNLKKYKIKPIRLFKDCLNNIHIITTDSAYQVYYNKETGLDLKYPTVISKFEYLLNTCVTSIDSMVYYQYYDYNGFVSQCYFINLNNKEQEFTLRNIIDTLTISKFEREFDRSYYMKLCKCAVSDEELQYLHYFTSASPWTYPPLYVPLLNINDTLCVFNHYESQIEFFSKTGQFIKKIPIDYNRSKDWMQIIFLDSKTNNIYVQFLVRKTIYALKKINLKDGTIQKTFPLPELPFIEKIKIYNNYVYFLYRNRSMGKEDNKMLYRMKLE